jgi:hypothetical protein
MVVRSAPEEHTNYKTAARNRETDGICTLTLCLHETGEDRQDNAADYAIEELHW